MVIFHLDNDTYPILDLVYENDGEITCNFHFLYDKLNNFFNLFAVGSLRWSQERDQSRVWYSRKLAQKAFIILGDGKWRSCGFAWLAVDNNCWYARLCLLIT